jgi:hypothetical protein
MKQALYAYPSPLLFGLVSLAKSDIWEGRLFGLSGLGWSLLLLSLPWTIGRIIYLRSTGGLVENSQQRRTARRVALAYIPVALLCAGAISWAMGFDRAQQAKDFVLLLFFPFSLPGFFL